jgi:molybdopterin/thiamine biosynthesis adenylyltransferase
LAGLIRAAGVPTALSGGRTGPALGAAAEAEIAGRTGLCLREVELAALAAGCPPARYLRNFEAYSIEDQTRLLSARLGLVGLGGLGGNLLEMLARLGVGRIRAADGDRFEESNLNRQLLSTCATLGRPKAVAAVERAREINPAVEIEAAESVLEEEDMVRLLAGCDLAVDALGGLAHRPALERAAARAGVVLVTGAMAGPSGYVAVVRPGEKGPASFLGQGVAAEDELGTQAPMVTAIAALMANEAVRLLTTGSSPLAGAMLLVDLAGLSFERVELWP